MALDPLFTVDDVEARLGRDLTAAETARSDGLIADVSAAVRARTGQQLTEATSTDVRLRALREGAVAAASGDRRDRDQGRQRQPAYVHVARRRHGAGTAEPRPVLVRAVAQRDQRRRCHLHPRLCHGRHARRHHRGVLLGFAARWAGTRSTAG